MNEPQPGYARGMARDQIAPPNVVGVYGDYDSAREAINALELIVDATHISLVSRDQPGSSTPTKVADRKLLRIASHSVIAGAVVGAIAGLLLGVLLAGVWFALDATADTTLWVAVLVPFALIGATVGATSAFARRVGLSDAWTDTLRDAPHSAVCVGVNAPNEKVRAMAADFMRRAHAIDVREV